MVQNCTTQYDTTVCNGLKVTLELSPLRAKPTLTLTSVNQSVELEATMKTGERIATVITIFFRFFFTDASHGAPCPRRIFRGTEGPRRITASCQYQVARHEGIDRPM